MALISGRVLALDVGKKRVGLAVTDPLGLTAQGLPTLHRGRVREDFDFLVRLCTEYQVTRLLIGRPLHLSGDESRQAQYTDEFGLRLSELTHIPVTYLDERLTSVQATRMLRDVGSSTDRRTGAVDRMAAVLLLQNYLEKQEFAEDRVD
ncbi:MAG: Holliday junction resolvase RuvX [Bryobacteraceae bacterium]|nr:Holliday junction resolvase RuvX [Bryobacteraceae bacterium]